MTGQETRPNNVLRVIPRTPFDFSGLAAGSSQFIIVAQHIDVSRATDLSLAVRLHSGVIGTSSSGGGTTTTTTSSVAKLAGLFGLGGTAGGTTTATTGPAPAVSTAATTNSGGGPPGLPSAGPYIAVIMAADLWTLEDPGSEFISVAPDAPYAVAVFTPQTPNPGALIVSSSVSFGSRVLIGVAALQAADAAGQLGGNLSIDLVMKGGDGSDGDVPYNTYLGYH